MDGIQGIRLLGHGNCRRGRLETVAFFSGGFELLTFGDHVLALVDGFLAFLLHFFAVLDEVLAFLDHFITFLPLFADACDVCSFAGNALTEGGLGAAAAGEGQGGSEGEEAEGVFL